MQILSNLDLSKNQALNMVIQNLASEPASPLKGQIYFNTTSNRLFIYGGSGLGWVGCDCLGATMTGANIVTAINGSSSIIDLDNLDSSVQAAVNHSHTHMNSGVLGAIEVAYTTALNNKLTGIQDGAQAVNGTNLMNAIASASARNITDTDEIGYLNNAQGLYNSITWATIKSQLKTYNDTLYNMYSHPTGDGNLHVPATGTTNNGKVLTAGSTAGSLSWASLPAAYVLPVATSGALGGVKSGTDITVDASGNVSVNDDSHNHVISNVDNLQSALDAKTPFATLSAATGATTGWYRIATSAVGIGLNAGLFKVDFTGSGVKGSVLFRASCHDGVPGATSINQIGFTSSAPTLGLTQLRVVYHTTAAGNYAYIEVYNPTALAITYTVDLIDSSGWSLMAPNTAGSIPTGYTSETLTCDTGVVSMEDVTAVRQLRSNIATGTAPLVVASTTMVSNLNAQYLNGQAGSYYAPLASPSFTGTPLVPTAAAGTNTTQAASTAFVTTAVANKTSVTGNAGTATKLATARTVTFGAGDVSGSFTFDGNSDVTGVVLTVADDSHNHIIANVDGLQTALDGKETPTGAQSKADTALNTAKAYADQLKSDILGGAGAAFDTLSELAAALGNDPNLITTLTNMINAKTGKYSCNIGDLVNTSFVITHNLHTQDITCTVRENTSPYAVVYPDVEATTTDTVTVRFGTTVPTSAQYRITITG